MTLHIDRISGTIEIRPFSQDDIEAVVGELGPEETKEFRDTSKYGGEEHTQKGAECTERSS
jgi:hypothetical protein